MRRIALFALALVGFAVSAHADTMNYQVSSSSSVSAYTNGSNGLAIETAIAPNILNGLEQFTLDDGQSETFNFFKIWSDETTINSDDTVSQDITANLDFDVPAGVVITIGGQTVGTDNTIQFRGHVLGTIGTGADVTWDNLPIVVTTLDRVFDVSLSDTEFNSLFGVYVPGELLAGTVKATITQVSSSTISPNQGPIAAPLPASFYGGAMLSLALAALRFGRRTGRPVRCEI